MGQKLSMANKLHAFAYETCMKHYEAIFFENLLVNSCLFFTNSSRTKKGEQRLNKGENNLAISPLIHHLITRLDWSTQIF